MRRASSIIVIVGLVVVAALVGYAFYYTSQPSFCSSCHTIAPFADSWVGSSHESADVQCVDCHFEPGTVGYLKGKVYSFMKLVQWVGGDTDRPPEAARTVVAGSCRHCHEDPTATFIPHSFHTEEANLQCVDCHSAVVHGAALVGEDKPQAAADPEFCAKCHTGDIAPILFGDIEPAGREHPGAPKIDVDVWRNIHWRMADGPAVIGGTPYDQIQPETCRACHEDPTQARACKGCHSARVPEFAASPEAERASFVPVALWLFLFVLFLVSVFLHRREKERFFSSSAFRVIGALVVASDVYVVYLVVRDTFATETGQSEIGPTTVWISYLLLSVALLGFLLFEASLLPQPLRRVKLPAQDEERYLTPRPIRRMRARKEDPPKEP